MVALIESLQRSSLQRVQYRAMASSGSSGGSTGSLASGAYGGGAGSSGVLDIYEETTAAARLYAMASRGHPYTSIRPIAVRIADLVVRVGVKQKSLSSRMKRMVEKAYAGDEELAVLDHEHSWALKQFAPPFVKQAAKNIDVAEDHQFTEVIASPNDFQTGWALMYSTAFSIEACGEAVWLLDWADGELRGIYYMPRSWVQPIPEANNPFAFYKLVLPDRAADDLPPIPGKYVCHFMKPNPANPSTSHCATAAQALAISTDDEIQKAQFHLTRNMSRPGMLVILGDMDPDPVSGKQSRPEITPEQRQQIVSQVRLHYTTSARFGDPLILDKMVHDVKPYMPTPADVDYTNGSALTKDRIHQGYGTNPIVTGQVQNGNRAQSYVAHDSLNFLQVNPLATLMSETMTAKIGSLYDEGTTGKTMIWMDQAKAKDPDLMNTRFNAVAKFGVLTKGEARRFLATGEFEYIPREDDDEPATPPPPPGNAAQPKDAGDTPEPGKDPKPGKRPVPPKPGKKELQDPYAGDAGDVLSTPERSAAHAWLVSSDKINQALQADKITPEVRLLDSAIRKSNALDGVFYCALVVPAEVTLKKGAWFDQPGFVSITDDKAIADQAALASDGNRYVVALRLDGVKALELGAGEWLVGRKTGKFVVQSVAKRGGQDLYDIEAVKLR